MERERCVYPLQAGRHIHYLPTVALPCAFFEAMPGLTAQTVG